MDNVPDLPEMPFDNLIDVNKLTAELHNSSHDGEQRKVELNTSNDNVATTSPKSKPIMIPGKGSHPMAAGGVGAHQHSMSPIEVRMDVKAASGSPAYGSSAESFVFVDLKAPFVQVDEQEQLNSFFVGPSPTFSGHQLSPADLVNLTSQYAAIESNIEQWDSFVESICSAKDDDAGGRDSTIELEESVVINSLAKLSTNNNSCPSHVNSKLAAVKVNDSKVDESHIDQPD